MHLVCMFVISGIHVFNKGNICFYNAQFCTFLSWSFIWRDYSECVFVVLCTSYSPLKWFIWMLFIMIINTDTFYHKSQLLKSQIKYICECQHQTFCLFVLWTESLKLFLPMCQQESFILQFFNFLKYNNIMIIYNINLNKNSNTIMVIILKTQTILKNFSFCAPWKIRQVWNNKIVSKYLHFCFFHNFEWTLTHYVQPFQKNSVMHVLELGIKKKNRISHAI